MNEADAHENFRALGFVQRVSKTKLRWDYPLSFQGKDGKLGKVVGKGGGSGGKVACGGANGGVVGTLAGSTIVA